MKALARRAPLSAMLLLAGCFVSDKPLFDATNAAATPLAAGAYEGCSGSAGNDDADCNPMTVSVTADGLYSFAIEDDRLLVRFWPIDEDDYAVQFEDADDDGEEAMPGDWQYYWARKTGDALKIVMIWCADLPPALVDKLVADGAVEVDDDGDTCTARSAAAVVVAAKAYAGGEVPFDEWVTMSPAPSPQ